MKAILMLVSAAALATAAGAQPPVVVEGESRSVRISYDDLNLASTRGRERLHHRVTEAVRAMCQDKNPDPLAMKLAEQRCYAVAIREAGDQIDQVLKARSVSLASGPQATGVVRR